MAISPIWPQDTARDANGELTFHGITASALVNEYGSPLYVYDLDEVRSRAKHFVKAATRAFSNNTTHVSYAAKAFLSKEIARIVTEEGVYVDTCTLGEMKIALAAGVPGRRLVLHGNNKSDDYSHEYEHYRLDQSDKSLYSRLGFFFVIFRGLFKDRVKRT